MAQIRSSRWWVGLTGILATIFLGSAAALTFVGWPHVEMPTGVPTVTLPGPSPGTSDAPIAHPVALDARPLTTSALRSVGEGWVLVEYDSSAGAFEPAPVMVTPDPNGPSPSAAPVAVPGDGPPRWDIPGPRYLYVVDPGGVLYAAGNLGVASETRLLAWLPDRRHAIVSQPAGGEAVTLHTFDLLSSELSDALPGPDGTAGGTWIDPEVRISTDGDAMLVAYGAGNRGIARVGFEGSPIAVVVAPVEMSGYVQSADGTILVVAETEAVPGENARRWTIATYTEEAKLLAPSPSAEPEPVASGTPSPDPGYGPYIRETHGLPPGEDRCFPVSWPPDRQLLNACPKNDGTVPFYTLTLLTSTFVDVSVAPAIDGDTLLAFNTDGTRIARGRSVLNLYGELIWRLVDRVPAPTGVIWAGESLLTWGDATTPPAPEFGAREIRARKAEDGELVYVLTAVEGASGFHAVVVAPAASDQPAD